MRFLDPTNGLVFKKIFGNENKKFIKHTRELEAVPAVIHEKALKEEALAIIKRLNCDKDTLEPY